MRWKSLRRRRKFTWQRCCALGARNRTEAAYKAGNLINSTGLADAEGHPIFGAPRKIASPDQPP